MNIIKEDTFRSPGKSVDITDDMVRVTLDLTHQEYKCLLEKDFFYEEAIQPLPLGKIPRFDMVNVNDEGPIPPCITRNPWGEYVKFDHVAELFFSYKKLTQALRAANKIIRETAGYLCFAKISPNGQIEKKIGAWAKKHP